ncbi:MAG: hypothetical protein F4045_11495 [Chloroflexi bacterium]|nr:hypothetical protein [Chloroflexota bacterium]MYK35695.1 hypothetical protein [Chloroflexota bacterium]
MPVKIWNRADSTLSSVVETVRPASLRGELFRAEAEALDREIDEMLDRAVALAADVKTAEAEQRAFVKRWAVGRALMESGLVQSKHLDPGEQMSLWQAIARKCRLGVRADGSSEKAWQELTPNREPDPTRLERDVFAVGLWLQEQELATAMMAFGGSRTNAREIYRRGAIRTKNVRDVLARWFEELEPSQRLTLTKPGNFLPLARALATRFPGRGPGSAKRPVHYSDEDLYAEICKVLDPIADELAPSGAESAIENPKSGR